MEYKFRKTNIYTLFGDIFKVNPKLFTKEDIKDFDFYENELNNLKSNIKCKHLPTDDDILEYMETDEYIEEDDVADFILFAKIIFEKFYDVRESLKNLRESVVEKINKNFEKEIDKKIKIKELEEKQLITKTEKMEILQIKRKEKQDDRLIKQQELQQMRKEKKEEIQNKQNEKNELRIYNAQVIICDKCGLEYIRSTHANHYKSIQHIYRSEGINWMINNMRSQNKDLNINYDFGKTT